MDTVPAVTTVIKVDAVFAVAAALRLSHTVKYRYLGDI
jgi:hypothetical protein